MLLCQSGFAKVASCSESVRTARRVGWPMIVSIGTVTMGPHTILVMAVTVVVMSAIIFVFGGRLLLPLKRN